VNLTKFYINGAWVEPVSAARLDVINPATEDSVGQIAIGNAEDADRAIRAARAAFGDWTLSSKAERLDWLKKLLAAYRARAADLAAAMTTEMGAPVTWSRDAQVWAGDAHLEATITALERMEFEHQRGTSRIVREGIGVCGLITPWNWPMNQIVCKVAPAIAAGCTMVLKPSEIAPLSGLVFAELIDSIGLPKGVFNLVNGDGPGVGTALATHPEVDFVSFTGSTRAGVQVAINAAPTVKRVAQEMGGKSPNIILADADIEAAVRQGTEACFSNTGQSCDAPTRMLVPARFHDLACDVAAKVAATQVTGDPLNAETQLGPVVSQVQWDKIQRLIGIGISEGAKLVAGGLGRPEGLNRGYYVRPTVFGDVKPGMTVEREEIFGPVLAIIPYETEDEAVKIANDSPYGLAGFVQSQDVAHARAVARRIRAGQVSINYPAWDLFAPFGGYKQSGNGREYADWGIHDFQEVKAIQGYGET
jgi:aldehyde dehydrogenase (NAD+)